MWESLSCFPVLVHIPRKSHPPPVLGHYRRYIVNVIIKPHVIIIIDICVDSYALAVNNELRMALEGLVER